MYQLYKIFSSEHSLITRFIAPIQNKTGISHSTWTKTQKRSLFCFTALNVQENNYVMIACFHNKYGVDSESLVIVR